MKKSAANTYLLLEQLGRGSYAFVHKAINRQTGSICAIKKIPELTTELGNLINEIKIMSTCDSKNIVKFLDSYFDKQEVLIVMEYCCGGSVKDVMRKLNRTLNQEQILVILKDVLNGLDYLHSQHKIHRDVKAANILLNEAGIAKLGDFGVSEPIRTSTKKPTITGTLLWLPPEVINRDPTYSTVLDIWSLGITIIEIGDGQPPYNDLEQHAALKEIANLQKPAPSFKDPTKWSQNLLGFLSLCLEKNASTRKSAQELLTHEIIKNAPSNDIIKSLVSEVCSMELEKEDLTNHYPRFEGLLKEGLILFNVSKERRLRVIKLDQLTDSLSSIDREFKDIEERMVKRHKKVNEITAQSKSKQEEILKLERERDDLKASLLRAQDSLEERKNQLQKVRKKLDENELQRRMKLKSLEGG